MSLPTDRTEADTVPEHLSDHNSLHTLYNILLGSTVPSTGAVSGAAGGVLGGTYPNPSFAVDMATQAELDAVSSTVSGKQASDADLTAIAALDSSTAGAIASDGAGWIKKTYSAFKTALTLVKGDVGLGNVDNTSDADKPVSTAQAAADALAIPLAQKGAASGVVPLNASTKIDATYLPASAMEWQGVWNASTNSPTLADGTGNTGDVYRVSVAGTRNLGSGSVTYVVGDLVIYDGSIWEYSHSTDSVASVFGRTGSVVAATNDYTLDQIATPTANFAMGSKKFTGLVNGSSAQDSAAFGQIPTGGTGGTNFCVGNDSRLTDSRTPTAHAASHASAGSDPVTLAQSQITGLVAALALLAPLASPALTGNPTAPTAAAADNDTSIATTAFVQGELASYVKTAQAVNAQTGTTYTLVAADAGKLVTLSNASAITLTLPQDSDATIAIGTYIDLYALGAGQITVAAGTGATLRTSGLTAKSRAQYARFGVQKVSANTWSLFGDLAAS